MAINIVEIKKALSSLRELEGLVTIGEHPKAEELNKKIWQNLKPAQVILQEVVEILEKQTLLEVCRLK
jgi:hypothetical protein